MKLKLDKLLMQCERWRRVILTPCLLLMLMGCANYDLAALPTYDADRANEEWKVIVDLKELHEAAVTETYYLVRAGVQPSETDKKEINLLTDRYLYHEAAATIHLFHGNYPEMKASVGRAQKAMEAYRRILHRIAREFVGAKPKPRDTGGEL